MSLKRDENAGAAGPEGFLSLVVDATTTAAEDARTSATQLDDSRRVGLVQAERSMAIIEPILFEAVHALRKLRVRPSKLGLGQCCIGGSESATGSGQSTRAASEVSAYGHEIGLYKFFAGGNFRGWRLSRPGIGGGNDILLERNLRIWAYGDRLLTAFVTGEPRCYVDQFAFVPTARGIAIDPDELRKSLAGSVARLAAGR